MGISSCIHVAANVIILFFAFCLVFLFVCFVFCLFFLFWFGFAHKDKCSVTGLLVLCTEGKTFTSVLLKDYEVHETSCNKNVRTKGHCNRLQVAHKTLLTLKVQGTLNVFKLLILK